MVTIQIVGAVNGMPTPYDGMYVAGEYTPGDHDFGDLPVTADRDEARRFTSSIEAVLWWQQRHPQGMGGVNSGGVNRPLTFFTVAVDPA